MVITPIALAYLLYLLSQAHIQFFDSLSTTFLLIGSGAVTVLPLLFFTMSAKKVTLSLLGILQYISPTIVLISGIFLYNETITYAHLLAFSFIWLALGVYTFPSLRKVSHKNKVYTNHKLKA